MSDSTTVPAVVVDPHAQGETANVVEQTNDHTPDPVQPPVVEHVPNKVTPDAGDGKDELREMVGTLADSVHTLQEIVSGLIAKDERPHSVQWTHAGTRHD